MKNILNKELLFVLAHVFVMTVLVFDAAYIINNSVGANYLNFDKKELIFFTIIAYGVYGFIVSFIWEDIIEQEALKIPASRKDYITMVSTSSVVGFLTQYIQPSLVALTILTCICVVLAVGYIKRVLKVKKLMNK